MRNLRRPCVESCEVKTLPSCSVRSRGLSRLAAAMRSCSKRCPLKSNGYSPDVADALVRLAVELAADDARVMTEATATALSLSTREARGKTLAEVCQFLPADELSHAAKALRRLDNAAMRITALVAQTRAITDQGLKHQAIELLELTVNNIESSSAANAARLLCAPLMPAPQRWMLLDSAFQPDWHAPDFDEFALLYAFHEALIDAPAALLR